MEQKEGLLIGIFTSFLANPFYVTYLAFSWLKDSLRLSLDWIVYLRCVVVRPDVSSLLTANPKPPW